MKKISLGKIFSTALLLVLSLNTSYPAFAEKIDLSKLSPTERRAVLQLKQQGKSDDQIRDILEQRKEEAQKEQMEPMRNK